MKNRLSVALKVLAGYEFVAVTMDGGVDHVPNPSLYGVTVHGDVSVAVDGGVITHCHLGGPPKLARPIRQAYKLDGHMQFTPAPSVSPEDRGRIAKYLDDEAKKTIPPELRRPRGAHFDDRD
jgi:hypothetical protein